MTENVPNTHGPLTPPCPPQSLTHATSQSRRVHLRAGEAARVTSALRGLFLKPGWSQSRLLHPFKGADEARENHTGIHIRTN